MFHSYAVLSLLGCAVAALGLKYYLAGRRPANFPPGPPTLPFIGNLHQLPKSKAFLQFHEWSKTHGSIVGLKLGPRNVVVLNSWRHVRELYDKRGAKYSSRPPNHIGNGLICPNETHILLVPYGEGWRLLRKAAQRSLNGKFVGDALPIQNAEATRTMHQLLHSPEGYYNHIRRYSTAFTLSSVFGQRAPGTFESPKVQALYHAQDQFTAILEPGATPPVDEFPLFKYVPAMFAKWKVWAKNIQAEQRSLYLALLEETKAIVARGKSTGSFMGQILCNQEKSGLDDEHVAYLGGTMMEAGSDTTASILLSYIHAMVRNPEAFKKAQQEVDAVCGTEHLPTVEDIDKLPYVKACMNEVSKKTQSISSKNLQLTLLKTLRWRPVAPEGIPHMLTEDDTYQGYHIPKGTMIFANTWSIHREEGEYVDPDSFVPERFLGNKFGSQRPEQEGCDEGRRVTYTFGAGRRACSGQQVAENSLMLNMAKIAWGLDISPTAEDWDWDVKAAYTDGLVVSPKRFPVDIQPRSLRHREVIEAEFESQRSVFAR